jgi:hypothetical protein
VVATTLATLGLGRTLVKRVNTLKEWRRGRGIEPANKGFADFGMTISFSESELVKSAEAHLATEFERAVFRAAMQSFEHEGNALRLNNFATALRELGRIHLELEAPDERVKKCDWFEQTPDTPKTFDIPPEEAVRQARQALEVFDQLFTFVRERREAMRKAAEDAAQEALRDVLYGEVNEKLDRLSTHTSVEGVDPLQPQDLLDGCADNSLFRSRQC